MANNSPTQSAIRNPQSAIPVWRDPYLWLTLALTIFAIAPFLLPGYFWGANDARHHVYFLHQYDRAVQDGIWWPRWAPDFTFGYGYPFFNIYGLFSHFIAEVLHHFGGLGYSAAIEAVFCLSIVACATTMYLYVRDWAGRPAAILSALVYTYIPYHLLNLYVRANLAESMAMLWLPLCLWAVRRAICQPSWSALVWCALSYGGLMLTSNLVVVLFTPLLGVYCLVVLITQSRQATKAQRLETRDRRPETEDRSSNTLQTNPQSAIRNPQFLTPALGLLAGLGLSANFWIPAFLEQQYVRVDQWFDGRYDFHDDFVYWFQLFSPHWGFGSSQPGPGDPISFQIGSAALVLAVIGVIVAWGKCRHLRAEIATFVLAAILSTALALTFAAPLWDLPLIGSILRSAQFPWRWFSIMSLCVSILAGLVLAEEQTSDQCSVISEQSPVSSLNNPTRLIDNSQFATRNSQSAILILAALVILASYAYLRVEIRPSAEGPVGLASLMRFQHNSDEMTGSTRWVKQIPTWSVIADHYINLETDGKPVKPVTTHLDTINFDYSPEQCFAANSYEKTTISEKIWFCNRRGEGEAMVFDLFYYPGWRAWLLDGEQGQPMRELPIIPSETGVTGRITVPLPKGDGYLLLRFEETPVRRTGRIISLITVTFLLVGSLITFGRTRLFAKSF